MEKKGIYARFFGNYGLKYGDEQLILEHSSTSKTAQLLQMLLYFHKTGIPRYRLLENLVGQEERANPINNLKGALSRLRKLLGETILPDMECIVAQNGIYSWTQEIPVTTDVEEFARLTGDYNKMHMDEAFAADQWFQKRVAHGMFSSSLLSSVMGMKLPGEGTILMEESSIFRKPVFFGDMLTAEITFAGYQEEKMFYIGEFTGICRNQKGEVVTEMKARQMMMKKLFEIGGSEDDKSEKI